MPTLTELRQRCKDLGITCPSLRKQELEVYLQAVEHDRQQGLTAPFQEPTVTLLPPTPVYPDQNLNWKTHLHHYGWAVAPIEIDVREYRDRYWSYLESCSGGRLQRQQPNTHLSGNLPIARYGIYKQYMGHLEWVWQLRETCYPIFRELWGNDDLLVAFDGGCFLPGQPQPTPPTSFKSWMHWDQGRWSEAFCSVQGIVCLTPSGPNDGGLVLLEGSRDRFASYHQRHQSHGHFWHKIDMTDLDLSRCRSVKVCAPEGSLVLWDSRVAHCNIPPNSTQYRMCTYVSMMPRSGASQEEIQKRVKWYEEGAMTGHWCYGPWLTKNAKDPHTYSKPHCRPQRVEIAPANTTLRRRLIGYDS